MENLQTVLWFLVALGILVTFHEFGHFYVARRCGVKVLRFSIGFGNPLFGWRDKRGTEFCVAPIPLGGYVKMLDEREGEVAEPDLPYAFNRQSVWKRMAIVSAGPIANIILAVLFFWVVLVQGEADLVPIVYKVESGSIAAQGGLEAGQEIVAIDGKPTPTWQDVRLQLFNRLGETGNIVFTIRYADSDKEYTSEAPIKDWMQGIEEPDPIAGLGLQLLQPPVVVAEVTPDGPGARAGLQAKDRIVSIAGEEVNGWNQFATYIASHPGETFELSVERDGVELPLWVTPEATTNDQGETIGLLRVGGDGTVPEKLIRRFHYSIPGAFVKAAQETWNTCKMVVVSFKKLILGQLSPKNLSGPITIAKVAGSSAKAGWTYFVEFLAFLSVMLGVLNLLPIPVLDGGHLAYFVIEAIKGSPVSERAQLIGFQIGMFLLVGVMLFALYNDFGRM